MEQKYKKKPIVVTAFQTPKDGLLIMASAPEWIRKAWKEDIISVHGFMRGTETTQTISINTLEGAVVVSPGDWIIKGIKGELYPCKPDIFEATYEKV